MLVLRFVSLQTTKVCAFQSNPTGPNLSSSKSSLPVTLSLAQNLSLFDIFLMINTPDGCYHFRYRYHWGIIFWRCIKNWIPTAFEPNSTNCSSIEIYKQLLIVLGALTKSKKSNWNSDASNWGKKFRKRKKHQSGRKLTNGHRHESPIPFKTWRGSTSRRDRWLVLVLPKFTKRHCWMAGLWQSNSNGTMLSQSFWEMLPISKGSVKFACR